MPAPMSMEAALDEERRGVLELLEGNTGTRAQRGSTGSAGAGRPSSPFANPRSPVRSMLDVDNPMTRHASIAGATTGITIAPRPGTVQVRSMLDIGSSPPHISRSAQTSPIDVLHKHRIISSTIHPRSQSEAAPRPPDFGPRGGRGDVTDGYQFSGYLPSNAGGPVAPKRNTLAGKKPATPTSANSMADAMKAELAARSSKDSGRHMSIPGLRSSKSRSPSSRGLRSQSPASSMLNTNSFNLFQNPGKFALDNGQVVDMSSAYRRLSDAHLALAGGSLSELSTKGRRRTDSNDVAKDRLEKDYSYGEGDDVVVESSDDDDHSSDEEGHRGRKKAVRSGSAPSGETTTVAMGRAQGPRTALSLMAAAEEERLQIAQENQHAKVYKVRSLLDPEITITGPGGDRAKTSKSGIHPTNAFDNDAPSGINTPVDSDTEADIGDIRRAQRMGIIMTPIISNVVTHRCVRTIYRGDFAKMQKEAEDDQRRVRKYLVATDMSDEAAHALEWTIGTVLRDGDTLLAIYCVNEETGVPRPDSPDPHFQHAQAATVAATTNSPLPLHTPGSTHIGPSPLSVGTRSANASPLGRERSRPEQERYHAIEDITQRVSKLLRKTKLQVRVVIEVIHCKSPKHLITEVIDYIEPTLVILGSRGMSNLKGVILGSFSNYLVTKSSVPVMVARKRLRKQGKYKRPSVRLANNLTNISGKSLANAKIDELSDKSYH